MSTTLITGTSTGIGFATAISLARSGRHVSATMRNLDRATGLRAAAAEEDLPIAVFRLDVDDDASVKETVAGIADEHGPIDGLVNNAGIPMSGAIEELPLARFRQCMETNFFGALRCIQAVVPGMRERASGCVVNLSSVAGRIASPPQSAYACSKWALEALSEILAAEVKAFGIRVAIVEPGVIATPIFEKGIEPPPDTKYPHYRRVRALFTASMQTPVSPFVVGDVIRDIVTGDSWQLRYPVGSDAQEFLQLRASLTDEQWIARGAQSDEEWARSMRETFGIDVTEADRIST